MPSQQDGQRPPTQRHPIRAAAMAGRAPGRQRRSAAHQQGEFLLQRSRRSAARAWIRIVERRSSLPVTAWQGRVADCLLAAAGIPAIVADDGGFVCDKAFVKRLMLAAAAVQTSLDRLDAHVAALCRDVDGPPAPSLATRLQDTGACIDADSLAVARLLFQHPGRHFCASDVQCLIAFSYPLSTHVDAARCLDGLAGAGIVQRIEWDRDRVFYDIDTRPHAHRYDPVASELRDA